MNVQESELKAHMTIHGLEGIRDLKRRFGLAQEEAKFSPLGLDPPWHAPLMGMCETNVAARIRTRKIPPVQDSFPNENCTSTCELEGEILGETNFWNLIKLGCATRIYMKDERC